MRAVRRSYGHNKHKNAIWRAQDAVTRENEGSDRGDDFFLAVGSTVIEVQVTNTIFFLSSQVLSTLWRALNSSIHVRYKGYIVAFYYSTRNRTV
jgi:hypothetical protein